MSQQPENTSLNNEEIELKITEDLANFYNYPAIGKLFSEPNSADLQNIRTKLNSTRERLDTIVRKGSNEEAEKATKALEAIRLTLEFLQNLEESR